MTETVEQDEDLDLESPVHAAFGLTYANYYVMPRAILEAMPVAWQRQWVSLVDQIHETFDFSIVGGDDWEVHKRNGRGRFVHDPLSNYRHPDYRLLDEMRRNDAPAPAAAPDAEAS